MSPQSLRRLLTLFAICTLATLGACGKGNKPIPPPPTKTAIPAPTVLDPCEQPLAGTSIHNRVISFDGRTAATYTFNGSTKAAQRTNDPTSIPYDPTKTTFTGGGSILWGYGTGITPIGGVARFNTPSGSQAMLIGPEARKFDVPQGATLYFMRICGRKTQGA
jgi:hypothetical protein